MEFFGNWSVVTTNFLIVLYLALGGVLLSAMLVLVNAQWRHQVYGYACAFSALLPIAFVLLIILLLNGHSTFPWLMHDDSHQHLSGWHNYPFLVVREIVGFLIAAGFSVYFWRVQQRAISNNSEENKRALKLAAALMPFVYVLYGTMVAWDFEMTMQAGWHSPIYAAYHFVSNFHGFLAFFAILLIYLKWSGKRTKPYERRVFNYLAQLMLGFTILWIYFYFSQYLIIWYGRLPEEMSRYDSMDQGLGWLWTLFISLKFVLPFTFFAVVTMARHRPFLIVLLSAGILVGTWLERYVWIVGSVESRYYHIPMTAWFDIAVTAAVVVVSWLAMMRALRVRQMIA